MRRQFVTNPGFQFSFTFWFIAGVAILFVFIGGASAASLLILSRAPELTDIQRVFFSAFFQEYIGFLFYLFLFSILIFSWVGLYLSYKFIGPLFRIESWLEDLIGGRKRENIRLRPGDELANVVGQLGKLADEKFKGKNR